jgi:hypothetical protein
MLRGAEVISVDCSEQPLEAPSLLSTFFREVKQPEPEAHLSPTSSTEINNAWNGTSITPYVSLVWFLINYTDKFTFLAF